MFWKPEVYVSEVMFSRCNLAWKQFLWYVCANWSRFGGKLHPKSWMEPRFIHKSGVGSRQRRMAAPFTDGESRICARLFVRKPRARSIRSHSRNKMLEPAIIEASMNLNIEHHTILSESEKTYSRHRPLILYSTLPVLFDFGAKGRMKGPTLRRTQKELPT